MPPCSRPPHLFLKLRVAAVQLLRAMLGQMLERKLVRRARARVLLVALLKGGKLEVELLSQL